MKAVVFYNGSKASRDKIMEVYPRHKSYLDTFAQKNKIFGIGPFTDGTGGSMGIFQNREDAQEFIDNDPFVLEGLSGEITIRDWIDD